MAELSRCRARCVLQFIPVRCEELSITYGLDGQLLLPLTIEHTIDERSPLCGHTYDSLLVSTDWAAAAVTHACRWTQKASIPA